MTLSTIETLQQKIIGQRSHKRFGAYDKCDYWNKSEVELVSQLCTQVMLLMNSKKMFEITYGPGKYTLPKDFDETKVQQELENFFSFFNIMGKRNANTSFRTALIYCSRTKRTSWTMRGFKILCQVTKAAQVRKIWCTSTFMQLSTWTKKEIRWPILRFRSQKTYSSKKTMLMNKWKSKKMKQRRWKRARNAMGEDTDCMIDFLWDIIN